MLLRRTSFARQCGLVDLEAVSLCEADVGGDAVACVEGNEVAWNENVGELCRFASVPNDICQSADASR